MIYSEFPLVEIFGTDGRMDVRTAALLEGLADLKNEEKTTLLLESTCNRASSPLPRSAQGSPIIDTCFVDISIKDIYNIHLNIYHFSLCCLTCIQYWVKGPEL